MAVTDGRPGLTWTVEADDRITAVHVEGEIDLQTERLFEKAVQDGFGALTPVVIVNLGAVSFMGSVGLRVLIQAHRKALEVRQQLRLVVGDGSVRRTLSISGMDTVLVTFTTLAEAVHER